MAYKEWTIYAQKHKDVGLYFYQENTATEEPSETEYLIVRNAVAANQSIPTPPFYNTGLTLGQYCNYNYPDSQWYEYFVYRMTLQFDNDQGIPVGAPIEYARIEVKPYDNKSDVDFDVVVQNGQPTYPHDPVVLADYFHEKYSENGGSLQTSGITLNAYNSILLNATGRSWLNITGDLIAKLCLKSSRDISATIPSDTDHDERILIDNTPDDQPRLIIHVTLSIPQPTTQAATDITTNEARLNGTIESIGWWLESYGFEFAEAGVPDSLSSITVGGSEDQSVTTFDYLKTGLSPGTTYYCRSWVYNAAGKGYGTWIVFTTPGIPKVTTQAASDIGIEHAKGNGTIVSGADITERGFEIRLAFSGTLGDYIKRAIAGFTGIDVICTSMGYWEGYVVKTKRYEGTFEEGAFVGDLGRFPTAVFSDQLFAGETYDYRAWATNPFGTGYGSYVEFTTNSWPVGEGPDDVTSPAVPIVEPVVDEVFSSFPPDDPSYSIPPGLKFLAWTYPPFEYAPWEFPNVVFPPWQDPAFNWSPEPEIDPDITFGRTFSAFIRRLDTKKDWKTLREKCIIYQENMNQFALAINHNTLVLKNLVNDIITYIDENVYPSDLKLMNSSQHLTPLYLEEISPNGFKDIINDFRLKDTYNVHNLNVNFRKLLNSLNSLYESDYSVKPISYNASEYLDIQPTAKRMILQLDNMNRKSREVRELIVLNIRRIFTYV